MICPFRKQTETVDGTTSEYYMECYGEECPYFYGTKDHSTSIFIETDCERVNFDFKGERE